MYRWRWLVLVIWLFVLVIAAPLAARTTDNLLIGFGNIDTESQKGINILENELGFTQSTVTVVFSSSEFAYQHESFKLEVERIFGTLLESNGSISDIITPYNSGDNHMVSEDGGTIYTTVFINASLSDAMNLVPEIREPLKSDILDIWVTGGIAIYHDINVVSEKDLRQSELIAFPVILLALLIVFGTLFTAILPVVMGILSILVGSSLIYLASQTSDISIFALNIATLLGLGVAIDYSLLVVNRVREELELHDIADSIGITLSTAGKTILFSNITSVLGLSGLLIFDFMMLRSIGIGGVVVMLVSLAVALTLLPASIAILGDKINSLRLIPTLNNKFSVWLSVGNWVMKHPILVIVPLVTFLLLLGTPFLGVKLGAPWASVLPPDVESREGFDTLNEKFGPGEASPIIVVYSSPTDIFSPANIGTIYEHGQTLSADPRVSRVDSIVTINPNFDLQQYQMMYQNQTDIDDTSLTNALNYMTSDYATFMSVVPKHEIMAEQSQDLVRSIRSFSQTGDVTMYVSGGTADLMDSIKVMYGQFPFVVAYLLITIYIALFLLFRSVILPLKAVLMNGMSIFATYGALVFIFQNGHFENLLGFSALGFTDAMMPIVLFCIIFGLSIDYEVFLLSRIQEIYNKTGDNTKSVTLGLERTGRIITSAALVMVLACGSFALGDIVVVKMFGVGLGLAILIDATLVRALLVPAFMRIMGRLNWWAPRIFSPSTPEKLDP